MSKMAEYSFSKKPPHRTRAKATTIEFPLPQPSSIVPFNAIHFGRNFNSPNEFSKPVTFLEFSRPVPPMNAKLRTLKTTKSARKITTSIHSERLQPQILARPATSRNVSVPVVVPGQKLKNKEVTSSNCDAQIEKTETLEVLHIDNSGLKQFPILGPKERQIRLLSLQHNTISRLQNLVVLNNLIVLDLYNNKIERICGLESFQNLRVLLLGKNRIRRMEGFEGLKRLEILDLHGNQLRYLDNFNTQSSLRILNAAGNSIRSIRNFGPSNLSSLTELNLKLNRLRTLNGLEKAINLKKLFLSDNELQSISALSPLEKLEYLEEILLESNPLCSMLDYKNAVLSLLPTLMTFDRVVVTETMRLEATTWRQQKPSGLQRSSKILENIVDSVPPGTQSREAIINQARKRWESVMNFVKHNGTEPKLETTIVFCSEAHAQSELPPCASPAKSQSPSSKGLLTSVPETLILAATKLLETDAANAGFEIGKSDEGDKRLEPKLPQVAIVRPRVRKREPLLAKLDEHRSAEMESPVQISSNVVLPLEDELLEKRAIDRKLSEPCPNLAKNLAENCNQFVEKPECKNFIPVDVPKLENIETADDQNTVNFDKNEIAAISNFQNRNKFRSIMQRSRSVDTTYQYHGEDTTILDPGTGMNQFIRESSSKRRNSASNHRHVERKPNKNRGQTAKIFGTNNSSSSPNLSLLRRPMTGIRERENSITGKSLKRGNSLSTLGPEQPMSPKAIQKQGSDYLIELDGKTLSVFGQGALKHFLTWFPKVMADNVEVVKFHFVTYDSIVPFFGKLRQTYPMAECFQFRANNILILEQINALADLQGLTSLQIDPDGNPITDNSLWENYAKYRLGHWGLKEVNGEVIDLSFGKKSTFEPLGYLALSCLPQSTLGPLARKLHALQTFSCCSQSSSSEDSGRKKCGGSSDNFDTVCNAWDNDPVLLDVIGKESLVYAVPNNENISMHFGEIASNVLKEGGEMLRKLQSLEESVEEILKRAVGDILIDYLCLDKYMKKELNKTKCICLGSQT